jgi:ankyrin repeat protein
MTINSKVMAEAIISNKTFDPFASINLTTRYAIENRRQDLIKTITNPKHAGSLNCNTFIHLACEEGDIFSVATILADKRFDTFSTKSTALLLACKNGHKAVVKLLLEDGRTTPEKSHLFIAADNGHFETFDVLMKDSRIRSTNLSPATLWRACRGGNINIVSNLLKDPRVYIDPPLDCLYYAIEAGHKDVVKLLLQDTRVQAKIQHLHNVIPSYGPNVTERFLQSATKNGYLEIVQILLKDHRFELTGNSIVSAFNSGNLEILVVLLLDPRGVSLNIDGNKTVDYDEALSKSCGDGHYNVVEYISIFYENINSFASEPSGISRAALSGHLEIVKLLASDSRCEGIHLNEALYSACEGGHCEVVEYLLKETCAFPNVQTSRDMQQERDKERKTCLLPLEIACFQGNTSVVELLLQDNRADPLAQNYNCYRVACSKGKTEILEMLLKKLPINIQIDMFESMQSACQRLHENTIRIIMNDSRFIFQPPNSILEVACVIGHKSIIKLLLQDERFDPTADNFSALRRAIISKRMGTYSLLLADKRVNPHGTKFGIPHLRTLIKGNPENLKSFLYNKSR